MYHRRTPPPWPTFCSFRSSQPLAGGGFTHITYIHSWRERAAEHHDRGGSHTAAQTNKQTHTHMLQTRIASGTFAYKHVNFCQAQPTPRGHGMSFGLRKTLTTYNIIHYLFCIFHRHVCFHPGSGSAAKREREKKKSKMRAPPSPASVSSRSAHRKQQTLSFD